MNITTSITNTSLKNSDKGLVIEFIDLVVNFVEPDNYFGGQIRLTEEEDGISFQTTTEALQDLAIVKAKKLISEAQVVVPEPEPEYVPDDEPVQSEATSEAPVADTPASEAPQSEVTSETTSEATSEAD
ncbi:hypothetical protein FOL01_0470 [Weissella jogaejeotgali]|uniref:Uncharacterized protein n=1 Tax=Weissella jogaejeotgali TaxID=1631871 RepID=A0A1L6R9V1_9LACO|nr:hypothetical protein [Weissella jogaejeotgali]APS41329.1 hypothetical protein FOL01_0470 [Weissella jogaejeotgali]